MYYFKGLAKFIKLELFFGGVVFHQLLDVRQKLSVQLDHDSILSRHSLDRLHSQVHVDR
jgi:hypothetical protein